VKKIAVLLTGWRSSSLSEEEIYRDTGLDAEFVGHPVLDEMRA